MTDVGAEPRRGRGHSQPRRIGLVGCVKEKAESPQPARDLYRSALFAGRRAYVERSCGQWWILSAKHGLVHPLNALAPYDETLKLASRSARRRWSHEVLAALDERVIPAAGDIVEIHAGTDYRDYGLVQGLGDRGCVVEIPSAGMAIGEQLRFYKRAQEAVR